MGEKVSIIVDGGKATSSPQMAQSLGPKGINIKEVLDKINEKTKDFNGMKVPVEIDLEKDKTYTINVGTPPVSELIKKEIGIDKGSGEPNLNKVGNLAIEQVIKIAKMKKDSMLVNNLKSAVKSVIGSCGIMGVLVEGKTPLEINREIEDGKYDDAIISGKTEVSEEKKEELKTMLDVVKKDLEKTKAEKEKEATEEKPKEEVPIEGEKKEESKEGEKKEGKEGKKEEKPKGK